MLLADLVATSADVQAARGRLDKIGRLATLLEGLRGDEARIAVTFLSGSIRQGRLGIGGAALREARAASPPTSLAWPCSTSIAPSPSWRRWPDQDPLARDSSGFGICSLRPRRPSRTS